MKKTAYALLIALVCLLIAGCGTPAGPAEAEPTATPTVATEPPPVDTPAPVPPTPTPGPPIPTNTLVVPPAPTDTSIPPTPIPTAEVAPELIQLREWAQALQDEVLLPLDETATALEQLLPEDEVPDITTACAGIAVVLGNLAEAQGGLDTVGPPPTDDADLQECWTEFSAAVDDFEEGMQAVDTWCKTGNPASLVQSAIPLQTGAEHLENAAAALERWHNRTGF